MEDLINEEILENIHEGYEIYKVTLDDNVEIVIKYAIRERSCFADQDLKLVRHDHKTSWSLLADAEKALAEIVQQRFEEQAL